MIEWRGGVCLFSNPKVTSLMCGHVLRRHVSQKASDQVMGGLGVSHFSKPKETSFIDIYECSDPQANEFRLSPNSRLSEFLMN